MPSVAEPARTARKEDNPEVTSTPDGRFIVRSERYGYSIEVRDPNPETRFLPPPDDRTLVRKFFERVWLGLRPYQSQTLPALILVAASRLIAG